MKSLGRIGIVVIAAIACAWALDVWCYRPYVCNVAITEITGSTNAMDDLRGDYAKAQRAENNIERLRELESHCRTNVRVYVLIAANEILAGRPQNAVDAYRKALTIDPRTEIYIGLGQELVQLGRTDEAVDAFTTVARFSPRAAEWMPSDEVRRRVEERLKQPR